MARRLLLRGHTVTMVCGSYAGGQTGLSDHFVSGRREGQVEGIDIIEFDLAYSNSDSFLKRTGIFLLFAIKSIKVALTHSYDVVFATSTPLTAGIPGICARFLRRKPFVFEVRDLWPELPRAMGVITNPLILFAMSLLEWVSYRSADYCIGLAPGIVEGIASRGVENTKIRLVPNGCDLAMFETTALKWRPDGVNQSDLMAIFTGTHGQANGLNSALDAAAVLKERCRDDIKIVLIGQGRLKASLQKRAIEMDLTSVIFHDPVDKARLAQLMSAADIGLQLLLNIPAFYCGTSPNKFFDYIAAGLPVLTNYPGWLAGLITRAECGYSMPPEDPKALADALELAADDRGRLIQMGLNARQLAASEFDRVMLADAWVDVIESASLVRE